MGRCSPFTHIFHEGYDMKKNSIVISLAAALMLLGISLTACGNNADKNFIGTWQDASDANATFVISKSDKGLVLQTTGESATLAVEANGNNLNVDGTSFTFDEQKQELLSPGLFDSKIVFKKVAGEQK